MGSLSAVGFKAKYFGQLRQPILTSDSNCSVRSAEESEEESLWFSRGPSLFDALDKLSEAVHTLATRKEELARPQRTDTSG